MLGRVCTMRRGLYMARYGGAKGPRMRRTTITRLRRRKSPLPAILIGLLVLLIGILVYLSTASTEVPLQRIEQDVTNEALAQ